jgi:catechol 2,3-dioxygenase-like lactoylglutathione lyase family enzyme
MYKALHLSPMIPSYDVRATRLFFKDLFGFTDVRDEGAYVIMQKDNCMLHILSAGDIGEMEFYLEVAGIDELWNNIKDKLTDIKTKEPFDQEYGMREFHVIIPHTKTLMFVGQGIKS